MAFKSDCNGNSPAFSRSLVLSQLRFLAFSLVNRVVESREPGAGERLRAGSQGPGTGAGSQRARGQNRKDRNNGKT